jgi:transcriptional regulator with XRE-family HTH domain
MVNPFPLYDWLVRNQSERDAIMASVLRILREERDKRGLSMNVVAQRSGLSHSTVSLIERDLRSPTLDSLLRIADALDVDLGEIITRAGRELK